MGFLSALLRLEAKVQPDYHCATLVKVLIKRYRIFFIATISFIWLQLRLFYPAIRERDKQRKRQLILRLFLQRRGDGGLRGAPPLGVVRCRSPPSPGSPPSPPTPPATLPLRPDACVVVYAP